METKKHKNRLQKYKLPNEIVFIENADKDTGWMEKWYKGRPIGCIPHSFRALFLGGCGRGKSLQMKNLFLQHQMSDKPFKKLYIICPDAEESREWDDCEPTEVFDYIPDLNMFDGSEKIMIIIDDYEFKRLDKENEKKLTTLFRFVSTHKNASLMASYQSFVDCPILLRKVANVFVVYKPTSKNELQIIANRVGVSYEVLRECFKNYANGYHDSIMVDMTKNTPAKLRKNIFDVIEYQSSDSDDDDE
jgi:hypothetical protein